MTVIKSLRAFFIFILIVITLQIIFFLFFSDKLLVRELGKNYETFVLHYNCFSTVDVMTPFNCSVETVYENFPDFRKYPIRICRDIDCIKSLEQDDDFYEYFIEKQIVVPFFVYRVTEGELAESFGAGWDSFYVFILFKWVLLEKENTGIS